MPFLTYNSDPAQSHIPMSMSEAAKRATDWKQSHPKIPAFYSIILEAVLWCPEFNIDTVAETMASAISSTKDVPLRCEAIAVKGSRKPVLVDFANRDQYLFSWSPARQCWVSNSFPDWQFHTPEAINPTELN